MLCWPGSSFNQTVAIPCKDSNQFVAIIKQSKPSIEVTHIPGKICDVLSMNAVFNHTYHMYILYTITPNCASLLTNVYLGH